LTVGRGDNINFLSDLWCFEKCISLSAGVPYVESIKLKAIVA